MQIEIYEQSEILVHILNNIHSDSILEKIPIHSYKHCSILYFTDQIQIRLIDFSRRSQKCILCTPPTTTLRFLSLNVVLCRPLTQATLK